jgi:protein TonB
MRFWWAVFGYSLSVAVHVGLYAEVSAIPKDRPRRPTTVKVFETKKKEKKKEEDKKEDKPPPPPPKKVEAPAQPKNTPPPPTNATPTPAGHEAMAALPDFGIALSGGGEGGIAVPVAGMTANAGPQRAAGSNPTEKKVRGPAPKPSDAADACVEEPTKPKSTEKVSPQYSDEARAANVEGVV